MNLKPLFLSAAVLVALSESAPSLEPDPAAEFCVAEFDLVDTGVPCPGCNDTFDGGGTSAADSDSPYYFGYEFSQVCLPQNMEDNQGSCKPCP